MRRSGQRTDLAFDFRIGSVLKRTRLAFARSFDLAGIAGIAVVPGLIVPARDGYAPVKLGLPTGVATSIYVASILLGQSIVCFVAFQRIRGQPISLSDSLKVALQRSLPLVGIILFILVILGILQSRSDSALSAVIAGVILLAICWLMAMPVCVIEGLGPLRSFGRSWALSKGCGGKMLVLVLLAILAGLGLLATMHFIARAILSFGPSEIVGPVARINALAWQALWTTFFAILLAASYHELRAVRDRLVEIFE